MRIGWHMVFLLVYLLIVNKGLAEIGLLREHAACLSLTCSRTSHAADVAPTRTRRSTSFFAVWTGARGWPRFLLLRAVN
jgi:hypothetical protein